MLTELLNEVLRVNVKEGDWYCTDVININYKYYKDNDRFEQKINVHELAYNCKIWAFTRGYELMSGTIDEGNGELIFECSLYNKSAETKEEYILSTFEGYSEPEAIFKACQWILENYKVVK